MSLRFAQTVVSGMAVPFLGPAELERRRGRPYKARLGANEGLLGVSPAALLAARRQDASVMRYPDASQRGLRDAIAAAWRLSRDHVVVGAGIEGLLHLFARAFIEPGDVAVTSQGAFPGFDYFVRACGGRLEYCPYTAHPRNDLAALLDATVRARAKMLYLANPDNPTGSFFPARELESFLRAVPPDCMLLLDEAYGEFADAASVLSSELVLPNLVRLRSFSKAYGLAGARVGYAVGDPGVLRMLDRIRIHFATSAVAESMALAAFEDRAFLHEIVSLTEAGRQEYEKVAAELGVPLLPTAANFVAFWFDTGAEANEVGQFLEEQDVFVVHPTSPPLDRIVRVTVGAVEERKYFAEAMRRVVRPRAPAWKHGIGETEAR